MNADEEKLTTEAQRTQRKEAERNADKRRRKKQTTETPRAQRNPHRETSHVGHRSPIAPRGVRPLGLALSVLISAFSVSQW